MKDRHLCRILQQSNSLSKYVVPNLFGDIIYA